MNINDTVNKFIYKVKNAIFIGLVHLLNKFNLTKHLYQQSMPSLLHYMRSNRIHYAGYRRDHKDSDVWLTGVDFTYIEYNYKDTAPSITLNSIALQTVEFMNKNKPSLENNNLRYLHDYNNHYNLITAIASVTRPKKIVEVGTASGLSLYAWLRCDLVQKVLTWDVGDPLPDNTGWLPNSDIIKVVHESINNDSRWTQYIEDLSDDRIWSVREPEIRNSDLIFIDGPHNGYMERKIMDNILSDLKNKKQILILLDDVRLSPMVEFWDWLPLEKLDLAPIGHQSGTGIAILPAASDRN